MYENWPDGPTREIEIEAFIFLNKVWKNPQLLLPIIRERSTHFNNKFDPKLYMNFVMTVEGKPGLLDAFKFLKT